METSAVAAARRVAARAEAVERIALYTLDALYSLPRQGGERTCVYEPGDLDPFTTVPFTVYVCGAPGEGYGFSAYTTDADGQRHDIDASDHDAYEFAEAVVEAVAS